MRKILGLILLLVLFSSNAFAANLTATFGDRNSSGTYRLQATDDGILTMSPEAVMTGGSYANMVISTGVTVPLGTVAAGYTFIMSAANIAKNSIFVPTTAGSYTLDTGTNLSTISPGATIGEAIPFLVSNPTTGTFTMVGGSGTSLGASTWTVATLQSRRFMALMTASNSWTIF